MVGVRFLPAWLNWGNPLVMEIVLLFDESSALSVSLTLGPSWWPPAPALMVDELQPEQTAASETALELLLQL